jgi:hypothetical protein
MDIGSPTVQTDILDLIDHTDAISDGSDNSTESSDDELDGSGDDLDTIDDVRLQGMNESSDRLEDKASI